MKLFKSFNVRTEMILSDLIYGIGYNSKGYFIYIRKPKCQWRKRHGPFKFESQAKTFLAQIEDEYNAVKAKRSNTT